MMRRRMATRWRRGGRPGGRDRRGWRRGFVVAAVIASGWALATWAAAAAPVGATGGAMPDGAAASRAAAAGAQLSPQVWLPISLDASGFGPRPTPIEIVPVVPPPPTASPTATTAATATRTPTSTPPPTPTPPKGYHEPLTDRPSLDDLASGYTQARWYETMLEVLRRRYPTGHHIVTSLQDSKGKATTWTSGQTATFMDLVGALETTVHEMNHELGFQEGFIPTIGKRYFYEVRDDLRVTVDVVPTFNRSEIAPYVTGPLDNQYKSIYLTGQSGQQGFYTLLDEFNAYTHSLFTGYGTYDLYPASRHISNRDGLVTFMMYTEFYLRHARTKHPADYKALRARAETKDLVRLLWDRANFILDTTADIPSLALRAEVIEAEMRKADMLAEVEGFLGP